MNKNDRPVGALRNIGTSIARRLNEIGVETRGDLQRVGPVAAFERICRRYPNESISVCYYLYSLEGALKDLHWDAIADKRKKRLRLEAGVY